MDADLLEWLSYEELQELETDNLLSELQSKLTKTEKLNIDQILINQSKSQDLIQEIDIIDKHLQDLQSFIQSNLEKVQEIRQRAGPLEAENSQYIIEKNNISSLIKYLSAVYSKYKKT